MFMFNESLEKNEVISVTMKKVCSFALLWCDVRTDRQFLSETTLKN